MPLHVSSNVVLIIRRSKLYYTVSGIITIIISVMIPDAVYYKFDPVMISR